MKKANLNQTKTVLLASFLLLALSGFAGKKFDRNTASPDTSGKEKLPNIVLVITDQFRADACKREGFALNTTPFLDSLAASGTWFNKAYCASPACVPSRTSMMTGRFPSATRVRSNMNLQDALYQTDLVDVLKAKGYATALIGKNHSYLKPERFDYWDSYFHLGKDKPESEEDKAFKAYLQTTNYYADLKPAPFPAEQQLPARIVSDSKAWISRVQQTPDKPFFLYMSIPEPHNPYQVPEPYYSLFPPSSLPPVLSGDEVLPAKGNKWVLQKKLMEMGYPGFEKNIPRVRSNYYGMMRLIDDQLRGFVDFLRQTNLSENTLFIFVADHGDYTGDYGLIKKGVEVPECLTRIPMIWYGPAITKSKRPHTAHVSNVDILPTLCEMLHVGLPEGVQGRSLWPLLTGQSYPKEEFASMLVQQGYGGLHYTDLEEYDPYTGDGMLTKGKIEFDELNTWTQSGTMRMLRKDDWKLVYDMQGKGELYNLAKDPAEINNLFGNKNYTAKQLELLQDMMAWELRTQDPLPLPHPTRARHYGFKRDPRNYWSPYKKEPEQKLKANNHQQTKGK
ncbi:sulfatase family protein [Flavisolibacter nicotianae]|uniref:sulfatase family protein n=1 Tax=Flavisolibacter nicotianae TaxID=2364882 RepID=UPI000EAD4983|nr:sulfatase-like hydrolase/transferase [Flavisolibacter nicotianae]